MTWPVVELSSVAEVKLGRQRSPQNHTGPSMRPYLRAANVGWSGLLLDDVKQMNFTDDEMRVFRLQSGDLLLNEASGSPKEVGKPAIWSDEIANCAFQNTLLRVRPTTRIEPRYLLHYFSQQARSGAFARGSRGVGISHLGREALSKWPIPLPNLAEQRRIASILDHAAQLRAKRQLVRQRVQTLLDNALSISLVDTTTTLVELGDIALVKGGKRLPKGALYSDTPTSHPYIRVLDFERGQINTKDIKYIDDETHRQIVSYVVHPQDVVISIAGSIGQIAEIPQELDGANLTENAARIMPKQSASYRPAWLAAALRSARLQRQIESYIGQVTIGKLALYRIEKLRLDLPSVKAQDSYLSSANAIRTLYSATMTEPFVELFTSLQSRAFRGEL